MACCGCHNIFDLFSTWIMWLVYLEIFKEKKVKTNKKMVCTNFIYNFDISTTFLFFKNQGWQEKRSWS